MKQLFLPHFGIIKNGYHGKDGVMRDVFFQPSASFDEFYKERDKRLSGQLLDKSQQRKDRDWNRLANQVVGAEVFL